MTTTKKKTSLGRTAPPLPHLPAGALRSKPRSYEEWSTLARWGKLPAWEPLRPGFELRAAREVAKVTQTELAARLGVSQQAVAQAERPTSNPTIAFVATWARALEVPLTFALGRRNS